MLPGEQGHPASWPQALAGAAPARDRPSTSARNLFAHAKYGKEAGATVHRPSSSAAAPSGVILLLATQRPDEGVAADRRSARTSGSGSACGSWARPRTTWSWARRRTRTASAPPSFTKSDKGIGYLVGAADDPQIVRPYYIDGPAAESICEPRPRAREDAGTLTGTPPGSSPRRREAADTLLDDILAVVPADEAKVWNETVVDRLAELRPERLRRLGRDGPATKTATSPPRSSRYGVATGQVGRRDRRQDRQPARHRPRRHRHRDRGA